MCGNNNNNNNNNSIYIYSVCTTTDNVPGSSPLLANMALSLYGECVERSFLPNGVSLPCDHGLDFLHQLMREFNQFNQSKMFFSHFLPPTYEVTNTNPQPFSV